MANNDKPTEEQVLHRKLAVDCFNETWEWIEKKDKTAQEVSRMLNTAHASLYHWRKIGTALNIQRGEWLLARVYTLELLADTAMFHAKNCLDLTLEHNISGFDLCFAYECWARANALAGEPEIAKEYYEKAKSSADQIEKKGDRDYFLGDLEAGDWFGLQL